MEDVLKASFNYVSSNMYLVYKDGIKVAQSENFNDIKGYLYEECREAN